MFWWADWFHSSSVILEFLKNCTCPLGKLKTEFTSPIAKSTSPGLLDTTFFACWDQACNIISRNAYFSMYAAQMKSRYSIYNWILGNISSCQKQKIKYFKIIYNNDWGWSLLEIYENQYKYNTLYNKIAFTAIQSDNHQISPHNIKCFMEQNDWWQELGDNHPR